VSLLTPNAASGIPLFDRAIDLRLVPVPDQAIFLTLQFFHGMLEISAWPSCC
jgi:hypothetical protein